MKSFIGTHDGRFHADDVLATAMILYMHDLDPIPNVIRTRNMDKLNECSYVVDVGKVYDKNSNRFDHHQMSCTETFQNSDVPLSSSGLVYRDIGKRLIKKMISEQSILYTDTDINNIICDVYKSLYFKFLIEIDATDNGYKRFSEADFMKIRKLQKFNAYSSFNSIIGSLNHNNCNSDAQKEQFFMAVDMAWKIFSCKIINEIHYAKNQMIETKELDELLKNHDGSGYLILPKTYRTIDKYLKLNDKSSEIKFIIAPIKNGEWRIRAIKKQRFINLLDLISETKARELINNHNTHSLNGHPVYSYSQNDLIFIHKKKFIGSTKTMELAKQIIIWSIEDKNTYVNKLKQTAIKHKRIFMAGAVALSTLVGAYILYST